MRQTLAALLLLALPAQAAEPAYRDDRSTPEAVVASLYDALARHEWLRAWSYYREGAAGPYAAFRDGYADTAAVRARVGTAASEGAAGSVHSRVPVAVEATATDGGVTVFVGCYHLVQVNPSIQDAPPFRPIAIADGTLVATDEPFATATGRCDP